MDSLDRSNTVLLILLWVEKLEDLPYAPLSNANQWHETFAHLHTAGESK